MLLRPAFTPDWYYPLHQYTLLPSVSAPHQSHASFQGQKMFTGNTAATAACFIEYLDLVWRCIFRVINMTSCVYNSGKLVSKIAVLLEAKTVATAFDGLLHFWRALVAKFYL